MEHNHANVIMFDYIVALMFHMWTGTVMSIIDNRLISPYDR